MEFHGQEQPEFLGSKQGRLYLTTHRMIFNAKNQKEKMLSFSFPFITLSGVELEQPVFGSNYIRGKCRAQPNGNWIGECKFKLYFKSGGAIEFGQAMLRAASIGSFIFLLLLTKTDNYREILIIIKKKLKNLKIYIIGKKNLEILIFLQKAKLFFFLIKLNLFF